MSMSEIQEAAEIITSAVSPDANIIFGATLRPELEDELIITVIATGFDSAYFHQKAGELPTVASQNVVAQKDSTADLPEEDITRIDMDLDKTEETDRTFGKDEEQKNIWHY